MAKGVVQTIIWEPQPGPQTHLVTCPVFEVFFGGARGGGKTEASIGDWLQHSNEYGEYAVGLFVRRSLTQLSEAIARTKMLFPKIGATFNEKKSTWTMPNGARLKFAYLERDEDASNYQGHSYTRIYIEEAGDFPSPTPIQKLKATLRSAVGVPCGIRLTGNPGGPGHGWVKARYITPDPKGYKVIKEVEELLVDDKLVTVTIDRVFIPSKLSDNKLVMRHDPSYVLRLKQSGSEALVKAWLEGDWDIVDGAYFSDWDSTKHVLDNDWLYKIPKKATRFRSFDWGSSKPFSVGWWVLSDGNWGLPKDAIVRYREWYGASEPNVGLRMVATEVAKGIKLREKGEVINYAVADPAIFIQNGGPSIAQDMSKFRCNWFKADNKRLPGWEQLRIRLKGNEEGPLIYIVENCVDSIRTIPVVQHDKNNSEDLDTDQEDHALDDIRYACMSRPYFIDNNSESYRNPNSTDILGCTMNEIVGKLTNKRKQKENWE